MARAEATASSAGVRFMNIHLHGLFPHRTVEAIKGKRRQGQYSQLVHSFCQQAAPGSPVAAEDGEGTGAVMADTAGPSTISSPQQCGPPASLTCPEQLERLRSAIRMLIERSSRVESFQAGRLREIAQSALEGNVDIEAVNRWLGAVFPERVRRYPRRTARHRPSNPTSRGNREQKRRGDYAEMQKLFRKNMRSCLIRILDGDVEENRPSPVDFDAYWRPLMETVSVVEEDTVESASSRQPDSMRQRRSGESTSRGIHLEGVGSGENAGDSDPTVFDKSSLWMPITLQDVEKHAVRAASAPGPDGVSPRLWNSVPPVLRALLFNLVLLAGEAPDRIAATRTVFLRKAGMPDRPTPADYRPLSVGSVPLRQLHKILASRLSKLDIWDERQRGFRPVDGVCENVTILSAVLREARRKCRSVHMACVDLSKAFDTVAHQAIIRGIEEAELPSGFLKYIKAVYSNAQTTMQPHGDLCGAPIRLGRGVRQGDPLSPLLFNLVVDRALGFLSKDVGFDLGGVRIDALAYADDIVLFASTSQGLQQNLTSLMSAFERSGLMINASKTSVLSLVASGREKKVRVITDPTFHLGDVPLRQVTPSDVWRYLGSAFEGTRDFVEPVPLDLALTRVTRAPLKPQQRLRLLRDYLLPRYYHRWIVGDVSAKVLKTADVQVRASVRAWLRLPHDVPAGYFHAQIREGGLGLPQLKTLIPMLKCKRLQKLCRSAFPPARAAAETPYVARQLVWCENQMRLRGERVSTTSELRRGWAAALHASCDGSGLRESANARMSSHWVSEGSSGIPGADYVHYHHVRANCLPSRVRVSRGREGRDVRCRAGCPEKETPAHCVQRCFRTHGGRILRHNDLCRRVAGFLRQKGWQVYEELAFSTSVGRRRPDLTIVRDGRAVVVDAQVVSSEGALDLAHRRKVTKYESISDLHDLVGAHAGVPRRNVVFSAITISWRGVWSSQSVRELLQLGITRAQMCNLTTRVLWGSWMNWRRFNSITSRFNPSRRRTTTPTSVLPVTVTSEYG